MVIVGVTLALGELDVELGLGLGVELVWGAALLCDVVALAAVFVFGRAWVPQPAKMRPATSMKGMAHKV